MEKTGKKGQYAAVFILGVMLSLILLYIILVYPSEREEILGAPTKNESEFQNLLPNSTLLFSSGAVFEVGRTSGEKVFSFQLGDLNISYPLERKIVDKYNNVVLKTSIFGSNKLILSANNLNVNATKDLLLVINVSKSEGYADILVYSNTTLISEKLLEKGIYEIRIPKQYLKEDNIVIVQLKHMGNFWQSGSAEGTVKLYQEYYDPVNVEESKKIYISENNYQGNTLYLTFYTKNLSEDKELTVKINGKEIWKGEVNEGYNKIVKDLDESNIIIGNNVVTFEAGKGSVLQIKNVKIEFYASPTPMAKRSFSFDLNRKYIEDPNNEILVGVKVEKIISPGELSLKIEPYELYYTFNEDDLKTNAWSYVKINKEVLKEFGNKFTLISYDGRFRISGLVVISAPEEY